MKKRNYNKGDVFNSYTILDPYPIKGSEMALVKCKCGFERLVRRCHLLMGESKQCKSCSGSHSGSRDNAKHKTKGYGLTHNILCRVWSSMHSRCESTNKESKHYKYYSSRGITVCDRWQDIENFIKDMGGSYVLNMTIDRIDGSKGYSPENCRWATYKEQAMNKDRVRNSRKRKIAILNLVMVLYKFNISRN